MEAQSPEERAAERTIARFIAGMESEDLLKAAADVEALRRHPGWVMLQRLVNIEIARIRRTMETRPLDSVQQYAHANGAIRGLGLSDSIIDDVLATAVDVRQALELGG